jgi:DNA-binding winged helix-turn-helix (wHTH) protein
MNDPQAGAVWESANAAPADFFQNLTLQLIGFFRIQGCVASIAEELAQKVTGELTARVREVLRRLGLGASWISGVIRVRELTLDLERHRLWRGENEIHLSPKEFDLLALLMKNADAGLTHANLLQSVWGPDYGGELEYLRTYVHVLRKKIEANPANPEYIVSEPWIGYCFRIPRDDHGTLSRGYSGNIERTQKVIENTVKPFSNEPKQAMLQELDPGARH